MIDLLLSRYPYFIQLIIEHLTMTLTAILIAGVIGFVISILLHFYPRFKPFILSIVSISYTIPSIALLGFMITFTGIGSKTAIIALVIYGLLPMVRSTVTALDSVDPDLVEASYIMGSTPMQTLIHLELPMALANIAAGFRNMVVMIIALGGISAFIGAGGLGDAIFAGITTNNRNLLLLGSILVSVLAVLADLYFSMIEKWIRYKTTGQNKKRFPFISTSLIIIILIASQLKQTTYDIVIGAKPQTEQFILTEIMKQLIEEDTNLSVKLTGGIAGGTTNIHPALLKGDIDMYPEYTGTSWLFVLKNDPVKNSDSLFALLQEAYLKSFNLNWYHLYGFNNTFTLVISKDLASKYQIETFSDLALISNQLTLGANFDFFEREDGYDRLKEAYQFNFKNTKSLDISLKYDAFNNKEVDVILAFTTDPQLNDDQYVVLQDDLKYFVDYEAGTVINQTTLDKYPELKSVLDQLTGAISNDLMIQMNYMVDIEGKTPKEVASWFIREVLK